MMAHTCTTLVKANLINHKECLHFQKVLSNRFHQVLCYGPFVEFYPLAMMVLVLLCNSRINKKLKSSEKEMKIWVCRRLGIFVPGKKGRTIETISPRPQGPDLSVRFQPRTGIKVIFPITRWEELTISEFLIEQALRRFLGSVQIDYFKVLR